MIMIINVIGSRNMTMTPQEGLEYHWGSDSFKHHYAF